MLLPVTSLISDKLALWHQVGWQGALLSAFLETPIVPSIYIFGHLYDQKELERSLFSRTLSDMKGISTIFPSNLHEKYPFLYASDASFKPFPYSIWVLQYNDSLSQKEILVKGLKQGASGANISKEASALSKENILRQFYFINNFQNITIEYSLSYECYLCEKKDVLAYQSAKAGLFADQLTPWIQSERTLKDFRSSLCAINTRKNKL